jgi:hypothetical protein
MSTMRVSRPRRKFRPKEKLPTTISLTSCSVIDLLMGLAANAGVTPFTISTALSKPFGMPTPLTLQVSSSVSQSIYHQGG